MRHALVVFAKVAVPGEVKTRLTPHIHASEAAELYEAFLKDLLARFAGSTYDTRLYVAPFSSDIRSDLVPPTVSIHTQTGRNLGERMARAFIETFAARYDGVVVTGSDHPTLPAEFLDLAFESLGPPKSVVFGPADDGGYYLIGMNEFYPELFRSMEYSHHNVLQQTLDRLPSPEIDVTILPLWYDVDTPDDLQRLATELNACPEVNSSTRRVLSRLSERYSWIEKKA